MNELRMNVGKLREDLDGLPDDLVVHIYVGEDTLQKYLEDRYWRHIPHWCRLLLKRWDVTYISGMSVFAVEGRVIPSRNWKPKPFYFELQTQAPGPNGVSVEFAEQRQLPPASIRQIGYGREDGSDKGGRV